EKKIFCFITLFILFDKRMAFVILDKSFFIKTTYAVSSATSVPSPMAIPTLALAKAVASIIPSPTIATLLYVFLMLFTYFSFSSGMYSSIESSKAASLAIAFDVLYYMQLLHGLVDFWIHSQSHRRSL